MNEELLAFVQPFQRHEHDNGSPEVQISILTFVEISDTNKVFANYLMMEEISLLTAINKLWWIDNVEAEADVAKKLIYLATAIDVTIS